MKHSHTFTNFMAATRLCNRSTSHTPESRVRINVTLRRVRLATVGVEKQYVLRILNRCSKPWLSSMQCACAVLGLYGHLWPVWLYPLFSILAHKRHGFRKKKVIDHKTCVLISCTTDVWNISHSKNNSATYYKESTQVFTWSTSRSCYELNKTWIFPTDFRKILNIKFHENSSSWSPDVPRGRADRLADMTELRVAFRNFATAPTNDRASFLSFFLFFCGGGHAYHYIR